MTEERAETAKAHAASIEAAVLAVLRATQTRTDELPILDDRQLAQLSAYLRTLLLWRRRMALISTSDPVLIAEHHIVDSLHVAPYLAPDCRFADIGSGAGLPGIPLAIALPMSRVTLIESRRKKANFLRAACRAAELRNVSVAEERAEAIAGRFDAVVCRALGDLSLFLDLATKLLFPAGVAIAMKGRQGSWEVVQHAAFDGPRVVSYRLARKRERALLIYTSKATLSDRCCT